MAKPLKMSENLPQNCLETECRQSQEKIDPIQQGSSGTLKETSTASASSNLATTQLDCIIKELNEASAAFLQTLALRTKFSSDTINRKNSARGDLTDEDIPALSSQASSELSTNPSIEMKDFLKDSSSTSTTSSRFKYFMKSDDDDGMSAELNRLDISEENLRKELDLATCGFGLVFQQPQDPTLPIWRKLCCCPLRKR